MGDFHGTGIEIWAGFGPVGNNEKKIETIFEASFFMFSRAKKKEKLKHCSCINKVKKIFLKKHDLKFYFQLCLALPETPHRGTFIMPGQSRQK